LKTLKGEGPPHPDTHVSVTACNALAIGSHHRLAAALEVASGSMVEDSRKRRADAEASLAAIKAGNEQQLSILESLLREVEEVKKLLSREGQ
jgi:hypothetical protein